MWKIYSKKLLKLDLLVSNVDILLFLFYKINFNFYLNRTEKLGYPS